MALHAMFVKQRRDIFSERQRSTGTSRSGETNGTSVYGGFFNAHLASSQNIFECFLQICSIGSRLDATQSVLIIDSSPVPNLLVAIKDNDLRRPIHAQNSSTFTIEIFYKREISLIF